MRRRYRYGIFIASAILACAPLAMNNNVVKADAAEDSSQQAQGKSSASNPVAGSTNDGQQDTASKGNQQGQDQQSAAQTDQQQNTKGDTVATAKKIDISYDKEINTKDPIKVKAVEGLTEQDVKDYFQSHTHISISGDDGQQVPSQTTVVDTTKNGENKSIAYNPNYSFGEIDIIPSFSIHSENNDQIPQIDPSKIKHSMLLEDGDTIEIVAVPDKLQSNTWYKWKLQNGVTDVVADAENKLGTKLPEEINNRIREDIAAGEVTEKTDKDGTLPRLYNDDSKIAEIDLGEQDMAPKITFVITKGDDKDVVEIPHNILNMGVDRNVINGVPTGNTIFNDTSSWNIHNNKDTMAKPGTGHYEKPDNPDEDITDETANGKPDYGDEFQYGKADSTDDVIDHTIDPDINFTDTSKPIAEDKLIDKNINDLVYIHTAFVYDEKGNLAIDNGSYQYKRKNQKAELLDDGRVYLINGEEYCKISYDPARYVKIDDIGRITNKQQKINRHGTISASSKYSVLLYNADGEAINILTKTKHVNFDQKKHVNGHTFYRIKGTKYWVRSGSIDFDTKKPSKISKK